jgi:excisionase family DNA binding protein
MSSALVMHSHAHGDSREAKFLSNPYRSFSPGPMKRDGDVPRTHDVTFAHLWYTISEAAEVTGIAESTIRTEIRENHLHPRRHGTTTKIVDAELQRWLRVRFPSHRPVARKKMGQPVSGPAGQNSGNDFSVEEWLQQTESQKR